MIFYFYDTVNNSVEYVHDVLLYEGQVCVPLVSGYYCIHEGPLDVSLDVLDSAGHVCVLLGFYYPNIV